MPNDFNQQIIEEFRANAGRVGGMFEGMPMILIHHIGAKSGVERVARLAHFPEDDDHTVIVASKGGAPTHPAWYHNLKANPDEVTIQDGPEPFAVRVREVTGDERAIWWERAVAAFPPYAEYQQKTDRQIPVLVATRAEA